LPTILVQTIYYLNQDSTLYQIQIIHLQQQIQQGRQSKNWTQKQLAQACNITESIVKSYESGKAVPTQQDIDKMSKALGVRLKNK